jgi:hypothetical protein
MTNQANAASAKVEVPPSTSTYGIERSSKVSPLGRSKATLGTLRVGNTTFTGVRLEVFEAPQNPPMDGMLVIEWIKAARAIVDYDMDIVTLPGTAEESRKEDARIARRGYTGHAMIWNTAARRFYVHGTVDGKPACFDIGTVSSNILDIGFARQAGIALGPVVGQAGGPRGCSKISI